MSAAEHHPTKIIDPYFRLRQKPWRTHDTQGALAVVLTPFVLETYRDSAEWDAVHGLALQLLSSLNDAATLGRIVLANRPHGSSAEVQEAVRPSAEALGFRSEQRGLFADSIPGLRPDYFRALNETGILLEVERGKTTTNNMDLLDFWKCHICKHADYLFLLVPNALQHNDGMTPKKEYAVVARRLGQFFSPGKYTNVRGLCLYGY